MHHRAAVLGRPKRTQRGVLAGRPAVLEGRRGRLGDQDPGAVTGQPPAHVGERGLEADERTDAQALRAGQRHGHRTRAAQPVLARRPAHRGGPPERRAGRDVLAEGDQTHLVVAVPGQPPRTHQHSALEDSGPARGIGLSGIHVHQHVRAHQARQRGDPGGDIGPPHRIDGHTALTPHDQVEVPSRQ